MNASIFKNHLSVVAVVAVAIFFTSCATDNAQSQTETPQAQEATTSGQSEGKQQLKDAPDFTLTKMDGESFTLSEHEGQVVILNIWATWCPPCRKEIPDFVEIQKEMQDEGVLFVGVSVDKEGWKVVRPFAKKYGINYPLLVDDGTIFQEYGPFRGIPTTFIINKKGKVEYVATGMINKKILQPVLQKLAAR